MLAKVSPYTYMIEHIFLIQIMLSNLTMVQFAETQLQVFLRSVPKGVNYKLVSEDKQHKLWFLGAKSPLETVLDSKWLSYQKLAEFM